MFTGTSRESEARNTKWTTLWLDGCFDGFHYAHANALRKARTLVDEPVRMIAAVHSDAEITKHKGKPLFREYDRYAVVGACRWVDETVTDSPYITDLAVLDEYHADFLVHGDDAVVDENGRDIYGELKARGRYLQFERTHGISTTSLIQRVMSYPQAHKWHQPDRNYLESLLADFLQSIPGFRVLDYRQYMPFCYPTYEGHVPQGSYIRMPEEEYRDEVEDAYWASYAEDVASELDMSWDPRQPKVNVWGLTKRESHREFKNSRNQEDQRRPTIATNRPKIYVAHSWDCFSAGHVEYLRRLSSPGYMLIAGVYGDPIKDDERRPLQSVLERILNVVQCKYVDGVIYNVPYELPDEAYNIFDLTTVINERIGPVTQWLIGPDVMSVEAPPMLNAESLRSKVDECYEEYAKRQERKSQQQ